MIRTALVYNRRNSLTSRGTAPIEVRVTQDRKSIYVNTGIHVAPNQWRCNMIINRPDMDVLNERLSYICERIEGQVTQCIRNGTPFTAEAIRKEIKQDSQDSDNALLWIQEEIRQLNVKEGTWKHYRTLLSRLQEYGRMVSWNDFSAENIAQFDSWLHRQGIGDAGAYNYHKCLKALLTRAASYDIIPGNPYMRLRGRFSRGERERVDYLSEEEMRAVREAEIKPGTILAKVRDLFVFQMYTGMAYADLVTFDPGNYKRDHQGRMAYRRERIKTGTPYTGVLLDPAVEVLERNRGRLPVISNQVYNLHLKALGAIAGISRPLHSHMARHTFATWALHNGIPIEVVSKMLGHTDISVTQRYAKVLAQDVREGFDRLSSKI